MILFLKGLSLFLCLPTIWGKSRDISKAKESILGSANIYEEAHVEWKSLPI